MTVVSKVAMNVECRTVLSGLLNIYPSGVFLDSMGISLFNFLGGIGTF